MQKTLMLFVSLILFTTLVAAPPRASARSPEAGASGLRGSPSVEAPDVDGAYHRLRSDLERHRAELAQTSMAKYGVDLATLIGGPAGVPSGAGGGGSSGLSGLFSAYIGCGNILQEVKDVYDSDRSAAQKHQFIVDKREAAVQQGYLVSGAPGGPPTGGSAPGGGPGGGGVIGAMDALNAAIPAGAASAGPSGAPAAQGGPPAPTPERSGQAAGSDSTTEEEGRSRATEVGVEELKPPKPRTVKVMGATETDYEARAQRDTEKDQVIEVGGEWIRPTETEESPVADVKLPDSDEWIPVYEGMEIPEGSEIYTGDGNVIIVDDNYNPTVIEPMTEYKVGDDAFSPAGEGERLEVRPSQPKIEIRERTSEPEGTTVPPNPDGRPRG